MDHMLINQRLEAHDSQADIFKNIIEEHKKEIATLKENVSNLEQCSKLEENKTITGKGDVPLERMIDDNSRQSDFASAGRSNIGLNDESTYYSSTENRRNDIGLKNQSEIGRFISRSPVSGISA